MALVAPCPRTFRHLAKPGRCSGMQCAFDAEGGLEGLEIVGHSLSPAPPGEAEAELQQIDRSAEESQVLGVSVAFLASGFLEEVESCFGEGADPNYHEINPVLLFGPSSRGAAFACPRDGLPGCSYVDALDAESTGPATVMLSWCWSYRVRAVVGSLARWCERTGRDPEQTFVWQCALCCNQFRVEETKASGESEPFEVFEAIFETRVRATMHVVALLDPWDSPDYIGRMWCIFEFWKAMSTEGCTLEVVLPEEEELRFKEALRCDGMRAMWRAFETVRIQDAQASVEADRVNILRLVDPEALSAEELEQSDLCAALNREVMQRLQDWCVDTAAAHAESQLSAGDALSQTGLFAGNLLMEAADFERAESILTAARDSMEAVGAEGTQGYLVLLRHEAQLLNYKGRHQEADELIQRVLEGVQGEAAGGHTQRIHAVLARRFEFPKVLCVAGETANLRGQLASAVELFGRARAAYETAGAAGAHGHTHLLTVLAGCLCRQGRHSEAEEALAECSDVLAEDSCLTPESGEVLKALGRCRLCQGRHADAAELFAEARRAFEDTSSTRSVSFCVLLQLMGSCCLEQDSFEEAQALFDEASALFEEIGAIERLEYQVLPLFYGFAQLREGCPGEAGELFEKARAVIQAAGTVETPEYGRLLLAMGKCLLQQGSSEEALELFNEAKVAYEAAGADAAFAHLMLLGA